MTNEKKTPILALPGWDKYARQDKLIARVLKQNRNKKIYGFSFDEILLLELSGYSTEKGVFVWMSPQYKEQRFTQDVFRGMKCTVSKDGDTYVFRKATPRGKEIRRYASGRGGP